MTKNSTLLLLFFFMQSVFLFAQNKQSIKLRDLEYLEISNSNAPTGTSPKTDKCGFAYEMNQAIIKGFNDAAYEEEMRRLINQRRQMRTFGPPTVIYTLPVIFHVIYDGNTESTIGTGANISQVLINAQIEQLNKDFADLSGSVYGVAEDMGIRFVAAKTDLSGNLLCEPGIERINWRSKSGWEDPTTLADITDVTTHYRTIVKPQSIWNPYQYLNIWLGNFNQSGLLGVATFPGQSTLPGLDETETDATAGVVVLSGSVGSLAIPGTASPYNSGRTLTHELGHFFGLRHITGDAPSGCGDDYCTDTPPQDELTAGCPSAGSLNNCIPSGPKMFENYMDYTDDACVNTFTLNQSERCQVVMLNSPRRKELITSVKGNSLIPDRIYFKPVLNSVFENATGLCPRYKDYPITIGVEVASTGNATVSLLKSGSATDGIDYTIFPASVTYSIGEASDKVFTLRVYDDAAIEGKETISLALNISGTGVQNPPACSSLAQFSFTINDDDNIVAIDNNSSVVTLLSQDFGVETGSNQVPAGWTVSGGTTNKWVGNNADAAVYGFTGNTLHISDGNSRSVINGTAPIQYSIKSSTDARVTTPLLPALGFRNISISLNLVSNGEADVNGIYDYGIVYYSLDGTSYTAARDINNNFILQGISTKTPVTLYLPSSAIGTNSLRFLFRWLSDNNTGGQPPFAIDDVVVKGTAVTVESQVNNNATESIPAGAVPSYFYSSTDGQIIAKLENVTESLPCATANVQNEGIGISVLNTSAGAYLRSEKVISINPSLANTTASYQATFYFTTAELAAWGANFSTIQLMKVKTGIDLGSMIAAADFQVVPATVSDLRSTKGYASFTGNFTGGFSQFLLVSPTGAVPVILTGFEAHASAKNIALDWNTSAELNNKGFIIERSLNGADFEKIGWVDRKINNSPVKSYRYTDNYVQPGILYFYRLRQTDMNGRQTLSEIRQAKIQDNSLYLSVSPNPAKNLLKLFTPGNPGLSHIRLLNTKGQIIRSWRLNTSLIPQVLDISNIAGGVYMIRVNTGQATFTEKVIIQ